MPQCSTRYKVIKDLLAQGDPNDETPLHTAAYCDLEMTQLLLHKGANPNAQNIGGDTPLHCACGSLETEESCKIVQLLLKHNADPNKQDFGGYTPLHLALRYNSLNTVKLLLEARANPLINNNLKYTALHEAARKVLYIDHCTVGHKLAIFEQLVDYALLYWKKNSFNEITKIFTPIILKSQIFDPSKKKIKEFLWLRHLRGLAKPHEEPVDTKYPQKIRNIVPALPLDLLKLIIKIVIASGCHLPHLKTYARGHFLRDFRLSSQHLVC